MAAVATAPMKVQTAFATSKIRTIAGWNSKLSFIVAMIRYMRVSIANTATNKSKFIMAGPLPVELIILATRTITKKTMRNYWQKHVRYILEKPW
jgi:hypothetical protein